MKKSFYLLGLLVTCFSLFSGKAGAQAVVTTDPVTFTGCTGTTHKFNVAATGASSFIWQVSADGTSWDSVNASSLYSTVTTDTLTVILDPILNGKMYRAIAFATAGNDTSAVATLHVDAHSAGILSGPDAVCFASGHAAFTSTLPGGVWSNLRHNLDTITSAGIDTGRLAGTDTLIYTLVNTCGTNKDSFTLRIDSSAVAQPITGPTAVCVGGNILLANANVLGTHTWTSSNTSIATVGGSTGVVHAVGSGVASITYSFTNTCNTVLASRNVSVETLISAGTISGPSTVCSGSWITLTHSAGGGIWLSAPTSVAVVDGSGNVTGIGGGVAVISYYFSNSCGASFASHNVTVGIPASPIVGNDSVGIDSTLLLTNATPGGVWTSSDITIATIGSSTGLVMGLDTGIVTITYSVSNICGSSTTTATVNVGPLPYGGTIDGPDTVCAGTTATFADVTSFGTVVSWRSKWDTAGTISSDGLFTPGPFHDTDIHGNLVDTIANRIDTIFATVNSAFGKVIVKRPVIVTHLKLIVPAPVSLGGSYTLVGSPVGGVFTSSNSAMAPLIGYGFFVIIGHGTTVFTYSVPMCGSQVARDTVTIGGPASVNNVANESESLSVFPNPSNGSVTVNLACGIHEDVTIMVTNVIGEKVQEVVTKSNTNTEVVLNQPSGVYLLTATTASGKKYSTKVNISK